MVREAVPPDLVADVVLYDATAGGSPRSAVPGYGCICMVSKTAPLHGYDARLLLGNEPLNPGHSRRLGFAFLTPDGAEAMRSAGRFFLWEGRFVGEATVVATSDGSTRVESSSDEAPTGRCGFACSW